MEYITWSEDLSVGVNQFDNEHKGLIEYVNQLNHAMQSGSAKKTIGDTLNKLIRYTEIHFEHEEYYMDIYGYPEKDSHKKEHDSLKKQVHDFNERFKSGQASFSLELMMFLKDWLVNHIKGSDMAYKDFFREKGV